MANKTAAIIDTAQSEVDREDYLFMAECYDAIEEAKQNERMIMAGLKTMALSQVWAKYHRMIYGE